MLQQDEKTKLKTLLHYWIEHNAEHSQEFKEWAEKVKASGEASPRREILEAAHEMDRVSELLTLALKKLES